LVVCDDGVLDAEGDGCEVGANTKLTIPERAERARNASCDVDGEAAFVGCRVSAPVDRGAGDTQTESGDDREGLHLERVEMRGPMCDSE